MRRRRWRPGRRVVRRCPFRSNGLSWRSSVRHSSRTGSDGWWKGQERLDALHEQAEAALMAWPRDAVDAEERESVEQYHRNYPVAMAAWSVARTVVGAVEAALADPGEETRMAAMRAIEAIEADSGHIWHEETRRFVSGELAARGVLLSAAAWLVEAKAAMGPTPAVVDAAGVAAQKKTAAENEAARVVVAWRAEIAQLAERVEAARAGGGTWTGAGPDALADEVRMALQRWPADQERSGPCRVFEGFLQDLALAREAGQRAAGFEQDAPCRGAAGEGGSSGQQWGAAVPGEGRRDRGRRRQAVG